MSSSSRQLATVTRQQALSLLAGVDLGRIIFTAHAMPAIRPASHLIEEGDLIVRSHDGSVVTLAGDAAELAVGDEGLTGAERNTVVAYQADALDTNARLGWSVVITGTAEPVLDPADRERYASALEAWTRDEGQILRIRPGIVTGYRVVEPTGTEPTEPVASC
jgi:hypothetical protein